MLWLVLIGISVFVPLFLPMINFIVIFIKMKKIKLHGKLLTQLFLAMHPSIAILVFFIIAVFAFILMVILIPLAIISHDNIMLLMVFLKVFFGLVVLYLICFFIKKWKGILPNHYAQRFSNEPRLHNFVISTLNQGFRQVYIATFVCCTVFLLTFIMEAIVQYFPQFTDVFNRLLLII